MFFCKKNTSPAPREKYSLEKSKLIVLAPFGAVFRPTLDIPPPSLGKNQRKNKAWQK
jgi:hypothetical protein